MQKKKRKQYTAAFKAKVVHEMLKEEKTVGQLAAENEVHSNMLYRWREQALAGLPSLFSDQAAQELAEKEAEWQQEREAFYAEIGRLSTQLTSSIRRIRITALGALLHNCIVMVGRSIKKQ